MKLSIVSVAIGFMMAGFAHAGETTAPVTSGDHHAHLNHPACHAIVEACLSAGFKQDHDHNYNQKSLVEGQKGVHKDCMHPILTDNGIIDGVNGKDGKMDPSSKITSSVITACKAEWTKWKSKSEGK